MSLRAFQKMSPDGGAARAWSGKARWPNGPECLAWLDGVVDPRARVMPDGLPAYGHMGKRQPRLSVHHSDRECARTDKVAGHWVHVDRVKAFNGFMRRAMAGVWHEIGVKRLGRYASEATFRSNRKADACLERVAQLVRKGKGRLVSCASLTAEAA